jgi:hypothetical protein
MMDQGKLNIGGVRDELLQMGIKPDIPFGLGDQSYFINSKDRLSTYKPLDIKG